MPGKYEDVLNVADGTVLGKAVLDYCRIVIYEPLRPLAVSSLDRFDHVVEEAVVRSEEEFLLFEYGDSGRHRSYRRLRVQKGQLSGLRIYPPRRYVRSRPDRSSSIGFPFVNRIDDFRFWCIGEITRPLRPILHTACKGEFASILADFEDRDASTGKISNMIAPNVRNQLLSFAHVFSPFYR
jgi:hypothetical protein